MKEIKTITKRRDHVGDFDKDVNRALADGWKLVRRYVDPGFDTTGGTWIFYPSLVAELEREVPDAKTLRVEFEHGHMTIDSEYLRMYDQQGRLLWYQGGEDVICFPKDSPFLVPDADVFALANHGAVTGFTLGACSEEV